jgi:hypothetical protein
MMAWPKPDRDCRELSIQAKDAGALVTITTRDGRRASRPVNSPDALIPIASALSVSIASSPAVDIAPVSPEPASPPAPQPERGGASVRRASLAPIIGAFGGGRVGTPGGWVAPVVRLAAGVELGSFEVAVFDDWQYWLAAQDAPPAFHAWSMRGGVALGARQPVGTFDLVGGLTLGVTFVEERAEKRETKDDGTVEIKDEHAAAVEPNVGAYVGTAFRLLPELRFRAQLEADAPANRLGATRELDSDLPPLPAFHFGLVLGVTYALP